MLSLIDAALVASLVVMVIISGYENFVSRFDNADGNEISWLGKVDAGSLKIKVASTIVAISSIHLLQVFLNVQQYTDGQLMWLTIIHLTFVVSALLLAYIDKLMVSTKKDEGGVALTPRRTASPPPRTAAAGWRRTTACSRRSPASSRPRRAPWHRP